VYLPRHFEPARPEELHRLIEANPLGAWVVNGPAGLDANHLPFHLELNPTRLLAHVARANPVWRDVKDGDETLVIFRGEQAYVSPNWYPSKHELHRQVPTWNYRVVHAHGRVAIRDDAKFVRWFGVATGQSAYPTPVGDFEIVNMQRNPWWYPPPSPWAKDSEPVPPGPGNPLGTRWMGLSTPYVGIHGTPDSASIGYSASHGCIRMRIPDAEWLFQHVEIGTPVFIVNK